MAALEIQSVILWYGKDLPEKSARNAEIFCSIKETGLPVQMKIAVM